MESSAIVGLGAGGHGRVIADIISRIDGLHLAGWLDGDPSLFGSTISDAKVLGDDCIISKLLEREINQVFIGVGSIGDSSLRRSLYEKSIAAGLRLPIIIDPSATISTHFDCAPGCCIFPHAVINTDSKIGQCSIVNTRATVEHGCTIGHFCHLAPGSILGGGCTIGNNTHIGIGAVIKEGISIGENTIIGAGTVVLTDIPSNVKAVGVPAHIL